MPPGRLLAEAAGGPFPVGPIGNRPHRAGGLPGAGGPFPIGRQREGHRRPQIREGPGIEWARAGSVECKTDVTIFK